MNFMKQTILLLICFLAANSACISQEKMQNQNEIPYKQIPEAPEDFSSGNVLARMVDGLGYRFYWASEGLRDEDIAYRPSEDAQSVAQTMDHMYGLSTTIMNATTSTPNIRPLVIPEVDFAEKRAMILRNLKKASDQLRGATAAEVQEMKLIFQRGEQQSSFPFWNNINGPIADAIYHTGQLVSFRRTTGNPMNANVNVFMGKNRGE